MIASRRCASADGPVMPQARPVGTARLHHRGDAVERRPVGGLAVEPELAAQSAHARSRIVSCWSAGSDSWTHRSYTPNVSRFDGSARRPAEGTGHGAYHHRVGAVPSWVWFNSAHDAGRRRATCGGGWCSEPPGAARPRGGSARAPPILVGICGPVALIGQYALPIRRAAGDRLAGLARLRLRDLRRQPDRADRAGAVRALAPRRRARRAVRRRAGRGRDPGVSRPAGGPPLPAARRRADPTGRRRSDHRPAAVPEPRAGRWRAGRRGGDHGVSPRGTAIAGPSWVRTATIRIRNLPAQAEGMRVALVSDLHLGSITGRDFCRQVVDLVNAQRPDMVLLAGTSPTARPTSCSTRCSRSRDLRAPDGVFFVDRQPRVLLRPRRLARGAADAGHARAGERGRATCAACSLRACTTSRAPRPGGGRTWTRRSPAAPTGSR